MLMTRERLTARLRIASCLAGLVFFAGASSGAAEGITLEVFGGSSLDQLAPRQAPDEQKAIQTAVIDGFLKANPDVAAVDWDAQGPQGEGVQRLMTARLGGQEIDLVACSAFHTNGTYVRRNLLMPITDKLGAFKDRIDAAALGAFTISGEVYGVPISTLSTSTIFYNIDMFEKLGIALPKTYEDLVAAVPKFQAAGVIPLLHQGANAPMWPMWYFETFSQASGDPIGKTQSNLAGTTKFTDAPDVEAFALIKKWVDDGVLSKDSLAVDMDGMRSAFATGKSAMYYGGTWEIPSLQTSVKDFKWGVFAFPKMAGTPGAPKHGGGADNGICLSSSIPPEKVDAAMRFVEYLTRPEVATLYLAPEQPIAASIAGVPQVEEGYAKDLRADAFPNTVKFLDWIWPSEIAVATSSAIAGIVGGTTTPEEAAASLQSVYDDLVAQGQWPPK
ncbi:ABC transporter substrate-binding protein [Prosthecomicrobium pneumaticum]|uniref:Raffinose/stachyose/melibiose transport system substrate-binding protein n=1 Tax=Prosthecomicrobium pneumaticum TaxID=81895 RepID=A0A7W9FLL6_9HYPH|nr:extracellular solute-binding protein [Prosthecomicrobium pneumaticum]MBB5752928.1 raffinose/stachyose/melibiose transport system substrate-binding protein [Prosthecomicrobium pneumaticum]